MPSPYFEGKVTQNNWNSLAFWHEKEEMRMFGQESGRNVGRKSENLCQGNEVVSNKSVIFARRKEVL